MGGQGCGHCWDELVGYLYVFSRGVDGIVGRR